MRNSLSTAPLKISSSRRGARTETVRIVKTILDGWTISPIFTTYHSAGSGRGSDEISTTAERKNRGSITGNQPLFLLFGILNNIPRSSFLRKRRTGRNIITYIRGSAKGYSDRFTENHRESPNESNETRSCPKRVKKKRYQPILY